LYAIGWHDNWNIYSEDQNGNLKEYAALKTQTTGEVLREYIINKFSYGFPKDFKKLSTNEMLDFFMQYTNTVANDNEIYFARLDFKESKLKNWHQLLGYEDDNLYGEFDKDYNGGFLFGFFQGDDELDEKSDIIKIESWLKENTQSPTKPYLPNYDLPGFFENSHEGESITVNEMIYEIGVEEYNYSPLVTFTSLENKYGLQIDPPFDNEKFPVILVEYKSEPASDLKIIYEDGNEIFELGKTFPHYVMYENAIWKYSTDKINWDDAKNIFVLPQHIGWVQIIKQFDNLDYIEGKTLITNGGNTKSWIPIGAEQDYKLTQDEFNKKYLTTSIKKFLENNCPTKT
jgi:hypothetical protein